MTIDCRVGVTVLVVVTILAGCTGAEPTPMAKRVSPSVTPRATSTTWPTELPTAIHTLTTVPAETATPIPPTPMRPTATPVSPAAPATGTVCASGCDFVTIQAAIDDAGTGASAIIEITDPIHTEAGIVVNNGITITIRGLGAGDTLLQAHETLDEAPERVFLVEKGANVTLERMTIRHGKPSVAEECGGGIMNHGTLALEDCVVSQNAANAGAGICNRGALALIDSAVSANNAEVISPMVDGCGSGSGIKCENGTLALVSSSISGNRGQGDWARGGGVTLTHALLPGSPAIDAIPAISCTLLADQRGSYRPSVQTSPDTPCDIGAFEVQSE